MARVALLLILLFSQCVGAAAARETREVRLGVLQYGTASWEAAAVTGGRLDMASGFALRTTRFATGDAAKVALQAGDVDIIVSDWLWVARRRAEGAALSFLPFSRNTGALLTAPSSTIEDLRDLATARIGIAGGPLDKNWLLLRAYSRMKLGADLSGTATLVYGSPPLLEAELRRGRIDALLTYWQSAARLLGEGEARQVTGVEEMVQALGFPPDLPLLGYVFREEWARRNESLLTKFWLACRAARQRLAASDDAWQAIEPLMGSRTPAVIALLKENFRAGTVTSWGDHEREAARRFFLLLGTLGGRDLLGRARTLPDGTFWPLNAP